MSTPSVIIPQQSPLMRRLSSEDATEEDLANVIGPTVVIPSIHLKAPSNALDMAVSMELARHKVDSFRTATASSTISSENLVTDKFAFAFDIDGVLIRGGKVIPEAIDAMKVLNGENEYGIKIPYIFLTNGGGKTEQERCIQLSQQLQMEVSPGQFICGHTPMREMAQKYRTVLVVGGEGEKCREVAEGYGFKDVVTPGDIIKDNEDTTPFRKLTEDEHRSSRARNFGEVEIEAILVFADSRDWASDQQIILDLLMSKKGRLGVLSETFDEGPLVFFSHNDVVWSASHRHSRIGMGALRLSLEAMFKALTGKELETFVFGKPQISTFQFAERLLQQWRKDTHGIDLPLDTVYFVGDTPESDVRGTNEYDEEAESNWFSVLVRTGVFRDGTNPKFAPKATVDNVYEAVCYGMEREYQNSLEKAMKNGAAA